MPTKKELQTLLEQRTNASLKAQRRADEQIATLEEHIEELQAQVATLKGHLRPTFLHEGTGWAWTTGTAHCPVCGACAPARMRLAVGRQLVVTARPIEHRAGCLLLGEDPAPTTSLPHKFHDPDGNEVTINLADIVYISDQIPYTTVIVTESPYTRRLAVLEKPVEVREARTQAFNASKEIQEQTALADEIAKEVIAEEKEEKSNGRGQEASQQNSLSLRRREPR